MRKVVNRNRVRRWEAVGGACCFLGGILAALLGSLLTASGWIVGAELHPWIHGAGTALLIVTIPLILFAGFCLDLAERGQEKPIDDPKQAQRGAAALAQIAIVASILGVTLLVPPALHAQQTIFNVPTTDVLDRGKIYAELDVSLKPTDSALVNKFSSLVPRVVVGAGNRIEVGLNITGNMQPGADTTTLVPAIKWKPYQWEKNGVAIAVGDHLYLPVRNRLYNAGNYVYAEISKTFKSGTRVTVGGYDFTRTVVAAANRAGGQFGFELPLSKKVTFAADWFTGKHAAGYFTPGMVFKVGPKVTGYAGYSIGNQNPSKGNHFFLLELGYNFN
jgi:hypothetical protein